MAGSLFRGVTVTAAPGDDVVSCSSRVCNLSAAAAGDRARKISEKGKGVKTKTLL